MGHKSPQVIGSSRGQGCPKLKPEQSVVLAEFREEKRELKRTHTLSLLSHRATNRRQDLNLRCIKRVKEIIS